jgi:NAD(P)-dependent dehydrogenase (short-subunit alcohol dehydrogenase family)
LPGRLSGKVAIVTGGGWNVGRAVAVAFAREGAQVAVAGRDEERLRGTLDAMAAGAAGAGGRAIAVPTDVTDLAACERLAARTRAELGPIDVAACIAGGGGGYEALDAIDPAWWRAVVELNLIGTFHTIRAALPDMRARGAGAILTCAGGGAFFPMVGVHASAYAAAKAGLCRLTDQLAVELHGAGIRVNCLQPEQTWSPDRLAEVAAEEARTGAPHPDRATNHAPEEAAELAVWLAADESAPLTGRTVSVNDAWWRDRAQVERVAASLHAYTLRRVDADATVPR